MDIRYKGNLEKAFLDDFFKSGSKFEKILEVLEINA